MEQKCTVLIGEWVTSKHLTLVRVLAPARPIHPLLLSTTAVRDEEVRCPELSGRNVEFVFVPEPQHQQCAKDRNDYPGRMKLRARFGTRKDVRHQSADN